MALRKLTPIDRQIQFLRGMKKDIQLQIEALESSLPSPVKKRPGTITNTDPNGKVWEFDNGTGKKIKTEKERKHEKKLDQNKGTV